MTRSGICLCGILVGLVGFAVSAQKSDHEVVAAVSNSSIPFRYETRAWHKEYGNDCRGGPKNDKDACVWIDFEYPEIISAPSEPARARINLAIQQWLLEEFDGAFRGGSIFKSKEALIQDFIVREKKDNYSDAGFWLKRKVEIVYKSANVLSLSREQAGFTGGAHENGRVDYANFRPSTGEPVRLKDVFKLGFEEPLNAIGEVRFRASENLDPNASLYKNNYRFPHDQFQLNDNFLIDAKGLTFQYNSYEVSCFACGAPTVFIPYSDLHSLMCPDADIP